MPRILKFLKKIHVDQPIDRQQLMQELLELKSEFQLNLALQSDDFLRCNKRLIFLDTDMTFIGCEMIKDMIRMGGKVTDAAEITNSAMDCEINFKEPLLKQVTLLGGVLLRDPESMILNIPYTTGVENLVYVFKIFGYLIGTVGGGFTSIIDHIKQLFALD